MKKLSFTILMLAFSISFLQAQTIPTTTVTGSLKINDSLNVTNNIQTAGDVSATGNITATGEVTAKDTLRAQKDIIVDGNAKIAGTLDVTGAISTSNLKIGPISFSYLTPAPLEGLIGIGVSTVLAPTNCGSSFPASSILVNGIKFAAPLNQNFQMYNDGTSGYIDYPKGLLADPEAAPYNIKIANCLANVDICAGTNFGFVKVGRNLEIGSPVRIATTSLNIKLLPTITKAVSIFNQTLSKEVFQIKPNGATYIGAEKVATGPHTDAMLTVSGKVACKEVRVFNNTSSYWADFVFNKNYKLMPLNEVEAYYLANKHLPNIPTAKDIEANGNELAKTDALLLQKIEELTIYIVQQQKEIEALKQLIKK